MSKYNFLFSLLKRAGAAQDIPQLTNFLKNSQAFKDTCWKIHDLKKTIIRKLDEEVGHVDPAPSTKKINGKKQK